MSDTPIDIIIDAGTIQTWVDTFTSIVDEARINFTEESIYVEAIDPANVAMMAQTLTTQACESYYAEDIQIGQRPDWVSTRERSAFEQAFDVFRRVTPPRLWVPARRLARRAVA